MSWSDEWRHYKTLKYRAFRSFFFCIATILIIGTSMWCLHLLGELPEAVVGFFCIIWVSCMLCAFTYYMYSWIQLLRFRCPRCHRSFVFTWRQGNWPSDVCKHCNLEVGAVW